MKDKQFTGVVLGGDMNSYAVARAFYEAYGIKTIVLGQHPIFPTAFSKIVEGYYFEDLLKDEVLIKALQFIQKKYPDKKKILFGNTDYYVRHIIHNRDKIEKISDSYIIPIVGEDKFDQLFNKSTFYEQCEKYGLDYPKSKDFNVGTDKLSEFDIPFEFPIFIKPSNTVEYAKYTFEGKQKGYKIDNKAQLEKVIGEVKASGYKDSFVFQEYIEGNDDSMFVYSAYVNSRHKVVAITGGKILMHDRTPELIGNYNAITNACDKKLCEKIKYFLEHIDFTGICHFDVQYDARRKDYVVFEMNIRQGRSNYYTAASGVNFPKLIVDDYINHKDTPFFIADKAFTVSVVPKCMLKFALKQSHAKPYKMTNFYRFGLSPYDRNIKRYMYRFACDQRRRSVRADLWQ